MPRPSFVPSMTVAMIVLVMTGGSGSAQEVRWRNDYAAARREATETGRPLLLDFGTEGCVWCRKLDATTFRDPKVVKLLNERFIPVKIDAQKEQRLTATLGIDGFPTLLLASPDGHVLGRYPGYADVNQLTAFLDKAPAPVAHAPAAAPPAAIVPSRPVALDVALTEAEKWRRTKEQLDADLAALHPKLAAALDR
jgi:thioredoxin-like negative regulator of GroEL